MAVRKAQRLLALLTIVALAAASCASGTSAPSAADVALDVALTEAIAEQMSAAEDGPSGIDGACFAEVVVPLLGGASRIEQEYGLTADSVASGTYLVDLEYTRNDSLHVGTAFATCGFMEMFIEDADVHDELSAGNVECLVTETDTERLADVISVDFMAPAERSAIVDDLYEELFSISLFAALAKCNTPIEVTDWVTISID